MSSTDVIKFRHLLFYISVLKSRCGSGLQKADYLAHTLTLSMVRVTVRTLAKLGSL